MQPFLLNTDGDPKNQPNKSSRLNINVNLNAEYGSISTEDGNNPLHLFPTTETYTATVIGKVPLRDGNIVLFSCVPGNSNINGVNGRYVNGEIGILSPDGSYRVVVRDNGPNNASGEVTSFGWNPNIQVQGIYKINSDNTTSVYFVDGVNPQRVINIDLPNIDIDNYSRIVSLSEFNKLNCLGTFEQLQIDLSSVDNNGNLPTGVYYVSISYADQNFNETNPFLPAGPVSIVNEINQLPIEEYDGAVANSNSPKSFTLSLSSINTSFSYLKMYVIAKINGVFTVYDYDYTAITNSSMSLTVNTLNNKPTSSLDVLISRVNWIPKTITQLDNKAYIANLKDKKRPNLQPWINGIVVDTATDYGTAVDVNNSDESFHNEKAIYTKRVFQHDEVYALYATVTFNDGVESEAYHIAGREPVNVTLTGDLLNATAIENSNISSITPLDAYTFNGGGASDTSIGGEMFNIDTSAKVFQAFDTSFNSTNANNVKNSGLSSRLGYWENDTESYPDTSDWDIKDSAGNIITLSSTQRLRGNKVRHHKMPGIGYLQGGTSVTEYKPLGLKFSNIQLPQELEGTITGIKFYYAKRTNANRLVFGQSLLLHDTILTGSNTTGSGSAFTDVNGLVSTDFSFGMATTMFLFDIETGASGDSKYKFFDLSPNRFRVSPFDVMVGDIDPTSTSYIKVFNKLTGDFTALDGVAISASGGAMNYAARLNYVPNTINAYTNYANYLRRLKGPATLAESVPSYPNGDVGMSVNANQLNYDLNTVHYRNDKHIILESYNDLDKTVLYGGNEANWSINLVTENNKDLALANLYFYKKDLYVSFDSQELIATTGLTQLTSDAFDGTSQDIDDVYGGDTFVSLYGQRGVSDLVPAYNMKSSGANIAAEWRALHTYVCETNANINYRNQGPGQYDIYHPKSDFTSVLNVPLVPNGFGNYYGYNTDYSSVNDLRQPKIHSKNYIKTLTHFPTRIARSAADNPESVQDNYRTYLPNEYVDIEKSKGAIINIVNQDNRLIIQHENSIKATATRDRIKTDEGEAFMGAGDLFDYPPKDLILTDSGYAGLKHQFASVLTQYGIFFPDYNTCKVFNLSDKGLGNISDEGQSLFFLQNIKLNFETYYRTTIFNLTPSWTNTTFVLGKVVKYNNCLWKNITAVTVADGNPPSQSNSKWELLYSYDDFTFVGQDSIYYGYISGFDNYYDRWLLTKKDITVTATFTTNFKGQYDNSLIPSWTLNSSLFIYEGQLYLLKSASDYDTIDIDGYDCEPIYFNNTTYFTPDRFTIAYYPEYKGWASWYRMYPDNYLANNSQFFTVKDSVVSENNEDTLIFIPDNNGPVDSIIEPIFNSQEPVRLLSTQWKTKALDNSGNEEVLTTFDSVQAYDSYQLSQESTIVNTTNSRNLEGYWSCNDFRDDTNDNNLKVVDNNLWDRPFTNNLNLNKHWTKLKKLVDFWFGVRFKYIPYTESSNILSGASGYSSPLDKETYIQSTLVTTPSIAVGDVLKLSTATTITYAKVISSGGGSLWNIKLYGPISFGGDFEILTIIKLTKKPKLHLLDVAKLVIKNIR